MYLQLLSMKLFVQMCHLRNLSIVLLFSRAVHVKGRVRALNFFEPLGYAYETLWAKAKPNRQNLMSS